MNETPEQLKPMQDLLENTKDGTKNILSRISIDNAHTDAKGRIDALERRLNTEASTDLVSPEVLKSAHKERIGKLRTQLVALKGQLDTRLTTLESARKKAAEEASKAKESALRATITKALESRDQVKLKEGGVDIDSGMQSSQVFDYYRAMVKLGRGDEAYRNILTANEKGGSNWVLFGETSEVTEKTFSEAIGFTVDYKRYGFLNDITSQRWGTYLETMVRDAEKKWAGKPDLVAKYKAYIHTSFTNESSVLRKDLVANKTACDKAGYGKHSEFYAKERSLIEGSIKTPAEWSEEKPPASAGKPAPEGGGDKPTDKKPVAPVVPETPLEKTEREKATAERTAYAGKVTEYLANWNELFGDKNTDGTNARAKWESAKVDALAKGADGNFKHKDAFTPDKIKASTDYITSAVRRAYVDKIQRYVSQWDTIHGVVMLKDASGRTKEEWKALITPGTPYRVDDVTTMLADIRKFINPGLKRFPSSPEASAEKAVRDSYIKKLDAMIARQKARLAIMVDTTVVDKEIAAMEDQKAKASDSKKSFDINLVEPYLDERRASGKRFSDFCSKELRRVAAKYPANPELVARCGEYAAKFEAFSKQPFEDVDMASFTDALRFYKQQIDNARVFEKKDTIDDERRKRGGSTSGDGSDKGGGGDKGSGDKSGGDGKSGGAGGGSGTPPDGGGKGDGDKSGGGGEGRKGPSEDKESALSPERARMYVSNFLFRNNYNVNAFNELIESDINDPKKAQEIFNAIKALQKKVGAKEDGFFGPATYRKLPDTDKKKLNGTSGGAGETPLEDGEKSKEESPDPLKAEATAKEESYNTILKNLKSTPEAKLQSAKEWQSATAKWAKKYASPDHVALRDMLVRADEAVALHEKDLKDIAGLKKTSDQKFTLAKDEKGKYEKAAGDKLLAAKEWLAKAKEWQNAAKAWAEKATGDADASGALKNADEMVKEAEKAVKDSELKAEVKKPDEKETKKETSDGTTKFEMNTEKLSEENKKLYDALPPALQKKYQELVKSSQKSQEMVRGNDSPKWAYNGSVDYTVFAVRDNKGTVAWRETQNSITVIRDLNSWYLKKLTEAATSEAEKNVGVMLRTFKDELAHAERVIDGYGNKPYRLFANYPTLSDAGEKLKKLNCTVGKKDGKIMYMKDDTVLADRKALVDAVKAEIKKS